MDAPQFRRLARRAGRPLRIACALVAVGLASGNGTVAADSAAARFDMRASVTSKTVPQSNGGYELNGKLSPSHESLRGGSYAIDADIKAVTAACGGDVIFANGFEL